MKTCCLLFNAQKKFLLTHMCSNRIAVIMKKHTSTFWLTSFQQPSPPPPSQTSSTIFLSLPVCEENIGELGIETWRLCLVLQQTNHSQLSCHLSGRPEQTVLFLWYLLLHSFTDKNVTIHNYEVWEGPRRASYAAMHTYMCYACALHLEGGGTGQDIKISTLQSLRI
jgi:hypothetical protein